MLSREDTRRLAELEDGLRRNDPAFVRRMTGRPQRRPVPVALLLACALAWAAALSLVAVGWWAAAIVAALWATVVACALTYRCQPGNRSPGPQLLPPP